MCVDMVYKYIPHKEYNRVGGRQEDLKNYCNDQTVRMENIIQLPEAFRIEFMKRSS